MIQLITGGAGFIGSNYVKKTLASGDQAIVLDSLTYAGNLENLHPHINDSNVITCSDRRVLTVATMDSDGVSTDFDPETERNRITKKLKGIAHVEADSEGIRPALRKALESSDLAVLHGDIGDSAIVDAALSVSDAVVNFAAETHVDRSIMEPDKFIITDVYGTFNLLERCRKHADLKKFVHISTDEVYGVAEGETVFKESDPINPRNPYSASKAAADRLVHAYNQTYGLPTNIIRPSNNFGPFQHPEKLIPKMIINAMEGEPLPVYGDGKQIRDWLFVRDSANAVYLVVRHGETGETYNVAGNNERTNISVVKAILEHLGKDHSLIKHVKDRPGHDIRYAIDDSKIREQLGYTNEDSFESNLRETIDWYVNNESWWRRILEDDEEYRRFNEAWYKERR